MKALQLKLDRARWYTLRASPFYGALAMGLSDVITPQAGRTACTDGKRILWNPDWLAKLTEPEVRFVLLHETLHCAHGHFWRLPIKETEGQQAGDYAINATLAQSGLEIQMPQGGLRAGEFDGKAEEEILAVLRKRKQAPQPKPQPKSAAKSGQGQQGQGQADGDGDGDADGDAPGQEPGKSKGKGKGKAPTPTPQADADTQDPGECGSFTDPEPEEAETVREASERVRDDWTRHVITAVQSASASQGTIPGDFGRLAEQATLTAKPDWRQETADFLKTAVGSRNDWSRSARRHAWQSIIYPRRERDAVGLICVARDTSGSIGGAEFNAFTALAEDLAAELHAEVIVFDADSAIAREIRLAPGEPIPRDAAGGGGTDFRPVFARVRELIEEGETIAGLVYLTDLYGSEPDPAGVDWPTLWLCTNEQQAKSGRTVRIEI